MDAEAARFDQQSTSDARNDWLIATLLFCATIVVQVIVLRDTWVTLVRTWIEVDTYNYGLVVPLLSAYLVFRSRHALIRLQPLPAFAGAALALLFSLIWLVGEVTGVLALQHVAVLGLIPCAALAVFGKQVFRVLAFPLLYLMLAVPVGEFLIPVLISRTADFSVMALEFIGVPVFRDGPYIRIPAGDFHVVKACSGIRYLLTSVVLGTLFAYLSFSSWKRRVAFVAICAVVPVLANWLRASGIILIGHLTDMRIAAGVDHVIYGWLFFGVVMLILFLIGRLFSDAPGPDPDNSKASESSRGPAPRAVSNLRTATAFFAVTLLGISGAIASMTFPAAGSQAAGGPGVEIALPSPGPDWIRLPAAGGEFSPEFYGAHSVSQARYRRGADTVSLLIVHYESQRQGSELISSRNRIFDAETWWIRFEGENAFSSDETGETLGVIELSLSDGERNQLIWSWYSISGSEVSNDFSAKLANFRGIISGKGKSASMVAIAARYENDVDVARSALRAFIADNLAPIRHSISRVSEVPGTQEP